MKKYKDKKQYRYKGYDYSQEGFYFVTICAKNREIFFGDVINGEIKLSEIGLATDKFWREIPNHFSFVGLDEFVVMPNHFHGIIQINVGTGHCPVPTNTDENGGSKFGKVTPKSLSTIIGSYKSIVTKTMNLQRPDIGFAWQSRFHDRIIRNEDELNRIRQYIINNPLKWELDKNNLENLFM